MRAILAWSPRVAGKILRRGSTARSASSKSLGQHANWGLAARSQCSTRWGHVESGEPGACSCHARDWQAPDDTMTTGVLSDIDGSGSVSHDS